MKKGFMKAVWVTCPLCQHNWHQEVIKNNRVESDCRCDVMLDMEVIKTELGGEWVNVVMKPTNYVKELGSFKREKHKISNTDMIIA